jgi:hypothetical protein
MIDSGASGNFISKRLVDKHGIATRKKRKGYELIAVDGSPLPNVDNETTSLPMAIQRHHEEVVLDVVEMARHDIVLGTPWLKQHNPIIDWKTGVLNFERCDCVIDINPTRRQRTVVDETRELNGVQDSNSRSNQRFLRNPTSADTDRSPTGQQARVKSGSHAPLGYPKEYERYAQLFEEEVGKEALPKH